MRMPSGLIGRLDSLASGVLRQRAAVAAIPAHAPDVVARLVGLEFGFADAVDDVLAVRREVEVGEVRDAHEVVDAELRGFGSGDRERQADAGDQAGDGDVPVSWLARP